MTQVAIICDSHFGVRSDSPVFLSYFKKSLEWFFQQVEMLRITHVIHLGDLFDRRKYLNFVTAKTCREYFLEALDKKGIETHIITGNHDMYYKDTHMVNSLREIVGNRYKNIHVHDEPVKLSYDGVEVQLIPWITDSNKEMSYKQIKETSADLLMGHFDIKGFELHSGTVSDHGDDKSTFDKFDLVFSGHYHHKSSQGNIHYLGAFAEYTWSDYNDPRGFTFFDTNTRHFELIRNPHSMFRMVSYDDVKTPDILEHIKKTDYSYLKDTYVKVICVNRENPYAFDMLLDKIYKVGPVDITILEDISTFTENDENSEIDESQNTSDILDGYIGGLTLSVNNDKMKTYMKDIYSEAISLKHVE